MLVTYPGHRWELKESLLNASIVVYMDGVFEHEVDEVGIGLHEVVQVL